MSAQIRVRAFALALMGALGIATAPGCVFDDSALEARSCSTSADCIDGYNCVGGYCVEGEQTACASHVDCSDGVFCNGDEQCDPTAASAGRDGCTAGVAPTVDDGVDCTEDICDESSQSVRHIRGVECICATPEDNQACVDKAREMNLSCVAAACNAQLGCDFPLASAGTSCGSAQGCRGVGECNETGECQQPLLDEECDDGDACNGAEVCNPDGSCVAGAPVEISDGIPCTVDTCENGEVVHDPSECECPVAGLTGGCEQSGNTCIAVVCSDSLTCEVVLAEEGTDCTDGFTCTGPDVCDGAGNCIGDPVDSACSNLDICDGEEICDPGAQDPDERGCISGNPPNLDDEIDCTDDRCENNQIIHEPGEDCLLCTNDAECLPEEGGNTCLRYFCNETCMTTPFDVGTLCDDGRGCTDSDACDGNGQCLGDDPNDAFCIDDAFCNGLEVCQPNHPNALDNGCRRGLAPDVDDGVECTDDACVECDLNDPNCNRGREGEIENTPTEACECRVDDDCPVDVCEVGTCDDRDYTCSITPANLGDVCDDGLNCTSGETCNVRQECIPAVDACECAVDDDCTDDDDNPCIDSGACNDGECVYDNTEEGTVCSNAPCAAASTCDGEGSCAFFLDNGSCADDCRLNALCRPTDDDADQNGCVYDVDPACLTPDRVLVVGGDTGTVGDPTTITVEARSGDTPLLDQTENLYCVARNELYFEGFDTEEVIEDIDDNANLTAIGDPGTDVRSGQRYNGATGLRICNGKGLLLGPFAPPPSPLTWMVRVRMASDGLGLNERFISSFKNLNYPSDEDGCDLECDDGQDCIGDACVDEDFVPMIALDASDGDLRDYQNVAFLPGDEGGLTIRLELLARDGNSAPGRCAFVDSVTVFAVPNYPLGRTRITEFGEYLDWSYSDHGPQDASMGFQIGDGDNQNGGDIEMSFFTRVPEDGHHLSIQQRAALLRGAESRGMEWHFDTLGGIGLPPVTEVPANYDRAEPIRFDWAMSFNNEASWSGGDAVEAVMFIGESFEDIVEGDNYRKIGTALPRDLPGPYATQYEVGPPVGNPSDGRGAESRRYRYVVELPEEMKPLYGRRLGFGTAGMSGSEDCLDNDACLYIDDIDLHTRSNDGYMSVEALGPQEEGSPLHEMTITGEYVGRVRVECYWQLPETADTVTIGSAPHYIEFTTE